MDGFRRSARRRGNSLVELLVVIAIVAILIGLLLVVIQRIRQAALFDKSMNNLRQINLATANFASANEQRLPLIDADNWDTELFVAILPYLEYKATWDWFHTSIFDRSGFDGKNIHTIKSYFNPLDPSVSAYPIDPVIDFTGVDLCAYAANAQVFAVGQPSMVRTFADGTSNTILFSEHYVWCNTYAFRYMDGSINPRDGGLHLGRPTFADGGPLVGNGDNMDDYYPITTGTPPTSMAFGNRVFQVTPKIRDCDPRLPQATSSRGLQAAMADGSVRVFSPSVSPNLFWGAVTPAGGEILNWD